MFRQAYLALTLIYKDILLMAIDFEKDISENLPGLCSDLWLSALEGELPPENTQIGNYTIRNRIAAGGMGAVFMAERTDGLYESKVAIKFLNPMALNYSGTNSIETERNILAKLNHPNIARIIDAGYYENRVPYFIMDYIEGKTITSFWKQNNLSLNKRLDLFILACKAIQYAHQNLIVHGDLKPDNVLVDKQGQVKIIDFGISRLLVQNRAHFSNQDINEPGPYFTPQYMAPEIARGATPAIPSDIYSLGLILFELLYDEKPYRVNQNDLHHLDQFFDSLTIDSIRKQQKLNKTTPQKSNKRIGREMESIVMCCLSKQTETRYQSVNYLVEDLVNSRKHKAVKAHSTSRAYIFSKWVRRHSIPFIVLFLMLISLVWIAHANIQRARSAESAWQEAQKSENRQKFVNEFITSLFIDASQADENPEMIDLVKLVEMGLDKVQHDQHIDMEYKSILFHSLAKLYQNMGLQKEAEAAMQAGLLLMDSTNFLASENYLDFLYDYSDILVAKNSLSAYALLDRALGIAKNEYGTLSLGYVNALRKKAYAVYYLESPQNKSIPLFQEALDITREVHGDLHHETAKALTDLAYGVPDQYQKIQALKEAIAIYRMLDLYNEEYANTLNSYALLIERQDPGRSIALLSEALSIFKHYESEYYITVLTNLAAVYRDMENFEQAEALYRQALELSLKLYPKESRFHTYRYIGLGRSLLGMQKCTEAITMLQSGLHTFEEYKQENNFLLCITRNYLTEAFLCLNDIEMATFYLHENLRIMNQSDTLDEYMLEPHAQSISLHEEIKSRYK